MSSQIRFVWEQKNTDLTSHYYQFGSNYGNDLDFTFYSANLEPALMDSHNNPVENINFSDFKLSRSRLTFDAPVSISFDIRGIHLVTVTIVEPSKTI